MHPNPIPVSIVMMDALRQAERLAQENQCSHAVVYRGQEGSTGVARLFVRLADGAPPDGAKVVTTVSRKAPRTRAGLLKDVVAHVVDNLPHGLALLDEAVIEFYPEKPGFPHRPREVFAYQFFSTERRNIATWIPDVSMGGGASFITGFDGRGRQWKYGTIDNEPIERIGWMIEEAKKSQDAQLLGGADGALAASPTAANHVAQPRRMRA